MDVEMDPKKYKKVLFEEIGGSSGERIEVVYVDEWAGRLQELEEARCIRTSVGHLEHRDGRWCADNKLVKELQEFLIEGECWSDLEEAKRIVESNVRVVYQ